MRLILSFAALLISIVFVQLSAGALGPLDALSGIALGFSATQIGALGSAHFVGFLIGCWWSPRLIGTAGHARGFAAFAAIGTIAALGHILSDALSVWAMMRVLAGIAIAGTYTVVESWMQAKVTNQTRGRVLGIYRVVDILGSVAAQLMIGFLEPAAYASYTILAILCCLSLLPLAMTTSKPPPTPSAPRLRPLKSFRLSPLGAVGIITAGVSMSAFRMVGPLYGVEQGLSNSEVGYFLAAALLGGAVAQLPVGWLADRYDRRHILIALSCAAIFISSAIIGGAFTGRSGLFLSIFLFGAVAFPLFSVSAAHANDFASTDFVVELNASLMFMYAVGAMLSPLLASLLLQTYGPEALFIYIASVHLMLILFGLLRMRVRPTPEARTPYTYRPRTSFTLQRLFRRGR